MRSKDLPQGVLPAVVVGAGPAGVCAALDLARRGVQVLLLGSGRRATASSRRGDLLLTPRGIRALDSLGLDGRSLSAAGAKACAVEVDVRGGRAVAPIEGVSSVPRADLLDAALARLLEASGAYLPACRVTAHGGAGTLHLLRTERGLVHARSVILATGLSRDPKDAVRPGWVAAGGIVSAALRSGVIAVVLDREGSAALLPLGGDRWSLSCLLSPRVASRAFLHGELSVPGLVEILPALASRLGDAPRLEASWVKGGLDPRRRPARDGAVRRVGAAVCPPAFPAAGLTRALGEGAPGGELLTRLLMGPAGAWPPAALALARGLIRSEFFDMMGTEASKREAVQRSGDSQGKDFQ